MLNITRSDIYYFIEVFHFSVVVLPLKSRPADLTEKNRLVFGLKTKNSCLVPFASEAVFISTPVSLAL